MALRLHVNIDHVATIRNARGTLYPDPALAAALCEAAGADGITAHLREDRRHVRDADVEQLRRSVVSLLNLEIATTSEMIAFAERIRPDVVTLVPERREERTTEGGLDVKAQRAGIEAAAAACGRAGIKLSLFVAPDPAVMATSRELGAAQVELHTGEYCHASMPGGDRGALARELERLRNAAAAAHALGLEVAAGHGLTRHNVGPVVAIDEIVELNIGHAIVSDAVLFGLDRAVRDMRAAIERARAPRGSQVRP